MGRSLKAAMSLMMLSVKAPATAATPGKGNIENRYFIFTYRWQILQSCNKPSIQCAVVITWSGGFHGSGYKALVEVSRRSQWRIIKIIPVFLTLGRIFTTESVVNQNTVFKFYVDQPHQHQCSICKQIWNVIILNKHLLNPESMVNIIQNTWGRDMGFLLRVQS